MDVNRYVELEVEKRMEVRGSVLTNWEETKRLWRGIQGKEMQQGFTHFKLIFTARLFTYIDSFMVPEEFTFKLQAT